MPSKYGKTGFPATALFFRFDGPEREVSSELRPATPSAQHRSPYRFCAAMSSQVAGASAPDVGGSKTDWASMIQ